MKASFPIIDADAHVVESDRTWDFMDPSDKQYRPQPLESREESGMKLQYWLIDGKVRGFRFPAFSPAELEKRAQQVGRKFADMAESREMGNVGLRLEHMDQTGTDVQVLHNTMFIESCADRPAVDSRSHPAGRSRRVLRSPDLYLRGFDVDGVRDRFRDDFRFNRARLHLVLRARKFHSTESGHARGRREVFNPECGRDWVPCLRHHLDFRRHRRDKSRSNHSFINERKH